MKRPRDRLHPAAVALLLLVPVAILLWPTLVTGRLPSNPDAAFHAQFAGGVASGLADGRLYPRWITPAAHGFGSPALVTYPPLSGSVTGVAVRLGLDAGTALRLAAALFTLLSGWMFYACARRHVDPLPAAAGAAFYLLLPYYAIDLHHRFALAELAAFLWLPGLVTLALGIGRRGRHDVTLLTVVMAALVFSHPGIAYLAAIVIAPLIAVRAWRKRSARDLALCLAATAAAMLLSAVYWLPLLAEVRFTSAAHLLTTPWFSPERSFLFSDEVALGFPRSSLKPWLEQSFAIQTLVAVAALVALRRKARETDVLLAIGFLIASLLQLAWSAPLWHLLPGLEMAQFPWRLQAFQVLFAGLLVASALGRATQLRRTFLAGLLPVVALLAALSPRLEVYRFDGRQYQGEAADRLLLEEHLTAFAGSPAKLRRASGRILSGRAAHVEFTEWSSHRRLLTVTSDRPRALTLRTLWFPGWQVRVDGRPVQAVPDRRYGAIRFRVPSGTHSVEIVHGSTRARRLGAAISAVALAGLAILALATTGRRGFYA